MEKSLQEVLTERIGQTVAIYGRDDFTVVSVHGREAKIEAPKTGRGENAKPAVTKYPKLRTLAAALEIPVPAERADSVAA